MQQAIRIPTVSIKPTHLSFFHQPEFYNRISKDGFVINPLPTSTNTGRNLSPKAMKRLKLAVNWLSELSVPKSVFNHKSKSYFNFNLNFITLTLPSLQFHHDTTIKNKIFNTFLTELRQYHSVTNYVWRCEAQSNGNIHFHLVTDTYINWAVIRRIWNRKLSNYGYVQRYSDKFSQLSFKEYCEIVDPNNKVDECILGKRYEYGNKSNWKDPNTTDIHSLRKVKNAAAYISKYISKGSKERKEGESYELKERRIKGRLWGCSQSLSKLKGIVDVVCDKIEDIVREFKDSKECKMIVEDYYSVVCLPMRVWKKKFKGWYNSIIGELIKSTGYERGGLSPRCYSLQV